MNSKKDFFVLKDGDTTDDLSLDMILGGSTGIDKPVKNGCDHCNTCNGSSGGNNCGNGSMAEGLNM